VSSPRVPFIAIFPHGSSSRASTLFFFSANGAFKKSTNPAMARKCSATVPAIPRSAAGIHPHARRCARKPPLTAAVPWHPPVSSSGQTARSKNPRNRRWRGNAPRWFRRSRDQRQSPAPRHTVFRGGARDQAAEFIRMRGDVPASPPHSSSSLASTRFFFWANGAFKKSTKPAMARKCSAMVPAIPRSAAISGGRVT